MTAVEKFAGYTTEELKAGIASIEARVREWEAELEALRATGDKRKAVFYRETEKLYQRDSQLLMQASLALEVRNRK